MSVSTLTVIMLLTSSQAASGETPTPSQPVSAQPATDAAPAQTPASPGAIPQSPAPQGALQQQPVSPPASATLPMEAPPLALPTLPMDARPAAATLRVGDDDDDDDNDIVVRAREPAPKEDPLQGINMKSYEAVQVADKVIVAPAAKTYSRVLPAFFRAGVRHFFSNLNEPIVALNFLLQHKVGKAFETVGRFGVNSTVGVAGLVDVAKNKPFHLPQRRNGFANTMGFYGVKSGPFLFVPLVGPTTVRDLLGLWVDRLVLPVTVGKPFDKVWYGLPATIIQTLDYRVEFDAQLQNFRQSSNPYAASRAAYLQSRQAEIDALHVHRHRKPKGAKAPEAAKDAAAPPTVPAPD